MILHPIEGRSAISTAPEFGAEVKPDACPSQQARRINFMKTHKLSLSESAEIPASFDPGPEFD